MTKPVYRPPAHLIIWGVMLWVLIVVVLGYTGDRVYRWATTPSEQPYCPPDPRECN